MWECVIRTKRRLGASGWVICMGLGLCGTLVAQDQAGLLRQLSQQHEAAMKKMQEQYDHKIAQLEGELSGVRHQVEAMRAETDDEQLAQAVAQITDDVSRRGLGAFGQPTVFDNTFNPALSLIADFVFAGADAPRTFGGANQFNLRGIELGITGRVDPLVAYYFVLHASEDELELEEGYGIADQWLPDTFSLRFGRMNIDFGRLVRTHDHDLPFVDKPGVMREYLNGAVRGTGLELHHWMPLTDNSVVRWSLGVFNDLDGENHPVLGFGAGEEEEEEEADLDLFPDRDFEDFAYSARVTALFDLDPNTILQVGLSAVWAPAQASIIELMGAPAVRDLEKQTFGFDLALTWLEPTTGEGFVFGTELFLNRQDFFDEVSSDTERETALGFYAYGEYSWSRFWSVGVSGGWFERAADSDAIGFDIGAYVTWRVNEFNRLRLELRHYHDELAIEDDVFAVMLQWTVILGSHGHGIPW